MCGMYPCVLLWGSCMASYYINLSLQKGQTPLMMASARGHVGCVQLLLDRGAQANHQDTVCAVLDVHVYVFVNV